MSKQVNPWENPNNYYALGSEVYFDGPYGERLRGEIVRTSSNPTYYHVLSDGVRYEVFLHEDNVEMIWDDDD